MNKTQCNKLIHSYLLENGFHKKFGNYLKVDSYGIVQNIFWLNNRLTDKIWSPDNGKSNPENELYITVQSLYTKGLFETFELFPSKGILMPGFPLDVFLPDTEIPLSEWTGNPDEQQQSRYLPAVVDRVLNLLTSQNLLYDLQCKNDIRSYGKILYVDSSKIAPLLVEKRYEDALLFCDRIIQQNEQAFEENIAYWNRTIGPEKLAKTIAIQKGRLNRSLKWFRQIEKWIKNGQDSEIDKCLSQERIRNEEYLSQMGILAT